MSSGSSGRYQSKLFNFVDQRSRRLTNQLKLIFHNIQVAAIANTEALFSPLFHLWNRHASTRNLLSSPKKTHPIAKELAGYQDSPASTEINRLLVKLTGNDISHRFEVVINYLFRLAINQKPLIDLPQEVESKRLPQIERSPVSELIEDDWLAWNDLFDQIKLKVNKQIKEPQHSHVIQAQPDWIEINARFLGYEKHPLERVLTWLDKILLSLEQVLKNCCFFFRGLLGG